MGFSFDATRTVSPPLGKGHVRDNEVRVPIVQTVQILLLSHVPLHLLSFLKRVDRIDQSVNGDCAALVGCNRPTSNLNYSHSWLAYV